MADSSSPKSSCILHSTRWRPSLEHLLNQLRKAKLYRPLPLSSLMCTCSRPDTALLISSTPSAPRDLLSQFPSSVPHIEALLDPLVTAHSQSAAVANLVYAIHCLVTSLQPRLPFRKPSSTATTIPPASAVAAAIPPASTAAAAAPAPEPVDSVTITTGEKEAAPAFLKMEEFQVKIAKEDVGVFISRSGFAHLIPKVGEQIRVHYAGHQDGAALLQVTALSAERIALVKAALEKHAINVTAARNRHRQALIQWSKKVRERAAARRQRVLSREDTEHRFLARVQNAYHYANETNLKMVSTSHYQRAWRGTNSPKSIETRKFHQLEEEEKRAQHEKHRSEVMCCGNCHKPFSDDVAAASCRFHSGYLLHKGNGKATWSCCGAAFKSRGKAAETEARAHSSGCEKAEKHAWRVKKAVSHSKKVAQPKGTVLLQIALE